MSERLELLKYLVHTSLPMVSAQYPYGYCQCPPSQLEGAQQLHTEGNIIAYPANPQPDGSFPVTPTEQGVTTAKTPSSPLLTAGQTTAQPDPAKAASTGPIPSGFKPVVEDNIPLPPSLKRGFASHEGGNAVDRYGFANLRINQSFHLPPSNDPDPKKATHRVFSSTVSQANTKLFPMAFKVREVGADDTQGPGARVWRVADMTGPRPTRKHKDTAAPAPQVAVTGWPAPATEQGQGGGFPAPGAFPGPGGYPAPGQAPAPFAPSAPFPENAPPAGFGGNGPSFG